MTGVTSVTFRGFSPREIITLAVKAELDGIEWGSDVHVPAGDIETAKAVRRETEEAGLKVLSYGGYYRLLENEIPQKAFLPYLESAKELNAPNIRIWTGNRSPKNADEKYYQAAADELKTICRMAKDYGISVSTEFHRRSLMENAESAVKLLKLADCDNLYTYWQPNPDLSREENRKEAALVRPYVSNVHVFYWEDNQKRPLAEGNGDWKEYLAALNADINKTAFIMEFVVDDSKEVFLKDAATMLSWF